MDVSCCHPNCQSGAILPNVDFDGQKAFAEVQAAVLVKTPDGVEFYCQNHRRKGLIREHNLKPKAPPKPPEPAPTPQPTPEPTIESSVVDSKLIPTAELIVVCQRDRILGVFSTKDKARGIRQLIESISPEPVYCQHWQIDTPGAQMMDEPEPPTDDTEVTDGREEEVQAKRKKKGRRTKEKQCVQQGDS